MNTRSMTNKRRTYRRRISASPCRGLGRATCRRKPGCRRATGTKRSFCRKSKNARI
jgi:hypothetical protein